MTCCQANNNQGGGGNDYQSYLDRRRETRPAPSQFYAGGYAQYQAPAQPQYMPVYYVPYNAQATGFGSFGGGNFGGGNFGSFGGSSFNNSFSSILQLLLGQLLGGSTGSSLGNLFGGSTGSSLGSLLGGSTGGFSTTTGSSNLLGNTAGSSNLFGGTTITASNPFVNQTSPFQFR